jgi:stage V sporulation protein SpoVS
MSVEELVDNYRGGGDGVSMPGGAIAEIMRQHRSDAEVQAAGCEALDQIISDEALGIGTAAAVSLAVAALRNHPGDDYAQFYGMQLLGQIAFYDRARQAAVVNAGAVPLIMTALREHADDADVQCIGFKAVARLLDISEDDDDNWVDVPFSPDSRVQLPAYRAIVAAGVVPVLKLAQARFPDDEKLQRLAPVLLNVLQSDEAEVLTTIDSIIDNICLAHEPPVPEGVLKQEFSSAVAAGRYTDAGVVSALKKWCGSDAAAERPLKKAKRSSVCANPANNELCLVTPKNISRRKVWRKHAGHFRMMQGLAPRELARVLKRNPQPPAELHEQYQATAMYVIEKGLCTATNAAAVRYDGGILCPNCFQDFIAATLR